VFSSPFLEIRCPSTLYYTTYNKSRNADKLAALAVAKHDVSCLRGLKSMAISEQLLEILVCPACRAKVELKPDGSGLKCTECKRVFPIRDDIPVMLVDEAKIEDEQPAGNN
jgi:uncharacterized protein YbaR (Trm112 family)